MTALTESVTARSLSRAARSERRWSNTTFYLGIGMLAALLLAGLLAPFIAPYNPNTLDLVHRLEAPSLSHPMGTDQFGRDIFSRVLSALRLDLQVTFIITYIPLVIGVTIGALAGYAGGWIDSVVMRVVDAVIAFPFLVLVMAIIAIVGPGLTGVYIGVPLVGWTLYARLTRGEMLILREQDTLPPPRALAIRRGGSCSSTPYRAFSVRTSSTRLRTSFSISSSSRASRTWASAFSLRPPVRRHGR